MQVFISILVIFSTICICLCEFEDTFSAFKIKVNPSIQANAAQDLVTRLLGKDKADIFKITIDESISENGMDSFRILKSENDPVVSVTGSNGVAAAWGVHHYLKNYCNCHISWDGDQLNLPEQLPVVNYAASSKERLKYYQNVCTSGYSFVWWDWPRWEREIDWMALNGINLALAFNAQEAIWQRVYDGFGLTTNDFTGPAFLAWNRMGNMRNFGGGLTTSWHQQQVALQHKILARMRELGITPVLPAFAGPVPKSFKEIFPDAKVTNMSRWNNFDDENCCPHLLSPDDPLFPVVSRMFLREYISEFGTNHIYNCDTFNENTPESNDPEYLASTARAIFSEINNVDPRAVWMLQGWMFIHPFWGTEQVKAYVTSVPIGRMLVLDLQSDLTPQYNRLESYFGQPFIWCTLHNFGGQLGLYGHLNKVNQGVISGRNFANSTMVGIGITPEGIDQNYVMYEFTLDSALRSEEVDLTEWVSNYSSRRYGVSNEHLNSAWQVLKDTAYDYNLELVRLQNRRKKKLHRMPYGDHIAKNILTKLPSLVMSEITWYNRSQILPVLEDFLAASSDTNVQSSALFRHDLVDVARQTIQFAVSALHQRLISAYNVDNIENFQSTASKFLEILDELDTILGSGRKFLLGPWLEAAKTCASNDNETAQYEFNARNQITLWGPKGEIRDYAAKQWSGLIADYYKPRWQVFISALNDSLINNTTYNRTAVKEITFLTVEEPFGLADKLYPVEPQGDSIEIVSTFHQNWGSFLIELFNEAFGQEISVILW